MSENRVVVGIDGSTSSRSALIWAAHEARLRDVGLLVVHSRFRPSYDVVFAGGFYLPPIGEEGDEIAETLRVAVELVEQVEPDLEVQASARSGPAALALLDAASEGAGLVVVGSRGLGAFGSLFLGSVSVHLAARSPVPVVVVPAETAFSTAGPVVVGVDGSAHAQVAVLEAAGEAVRRRAPLDIVASFSVPADLLVTPLAASRDEFRHAFQTQAQQNADAAARTASTVGESLIVRTHVTDGPPAREIARVARAASLVVVGSRGHGEIAGPVLGSVSQSLLRHATWPVLVTHEA
ncbi:universal stress protein [Oerskovia paurometabola]|uniref:universal stress protein n=1 Tax=Oerskovia paurometabola TaxID=162170 RepID=UPI00382E827E